MNYINRESRWKWSLLPVEGDGGNLCTRAHLTVKTEAKRSPGARPADYQFPRNVFHLFCKFYSILSYGIRKKTPVRSCISVYEI